MPCVVGMTTNLKARQKQWEKELPGQIYEWVVLMDGLTREQAQQLEIRLADKHGCKSEPGGRGSSNPNATWTVYRFSYIV